MLRQLIPDNTTVFPKCYTQELNHENRLGIIGMNNEMQNFTLSVWVVVAVVAGRLYMLMGVQIVFRNLLNEYLFSSMVLIEHLILSVSYRTLYVLQCIGINKYKAQFIDLL